MGSLLNPESLSPEGKNLSTDQDLPENFSEEIQARELVRDSSGNHWGLAKLFQDPPTSKENQPGIEETSALQDGMERVTRYSGELDGLVGLREMILEKDASVEDFPEGKAMAEEYRDFLLERTATITAIRSELEFAVSEALSDQDAERLGEEKFHGDGEEDDPEKDYSEGDSSAVKGARLKLAFFDGLLEELEEIDFGADADLAQSLEELEGVARDFYAYEEEWLWENFQNELQALERIQSRHPSLVFLRNAFEDLENLKSPTKEDFQGVHILFQIYRGFFSAEKLKENHPKVRELREKIQDFEKIDNPAPEDYAELLQLSETAALWTHVEIKIDTYSQWIDSTGLTDGLINGAGLWDTGVHRSDEMLKAQTKYIEVHRLLSEGNEEAAQKLFIQLEKDPEIYSLPSIAMASETINLCSISAGVVVASAATAGLAAELFGGYLAAGLAGARGLSLLRMGLSPAQAYIKLSRRQELLVGLTKFGVNASAFQVAHQNYETSLYGKKFFDPKKTDAENWRQLGWDTLMTAGMFAFLGGALKSFHLIKLPQIRQVAESRALLKHAGDGTKVTEKLIQDEIEVMTKTGIEAIPYRLGAFGAELASFGIWESIQLGLEFYRHKGEFISLAAFMEPLLSFEAWKQRFIFIISLKGGNGLAHPLSKTIHSNAREVLELKARLREILLTKERLTDPKPEVRKEAQESFAKDIEQMESKDLLELVRQWNYLVDDEILSIKIQLKIFKRMGPEDRLSFVKGVERLITPEVDTIMSYFAAELLSKMVPHLEMKDRVERVEAMERNYEIADNQFTVRIVAEVANYLTPEHRLGRALKIERDVLPAEEENVDGADALIKIARKLSDEHQLILVRQMLSRIPEEIWNYQDTQAVFRSIVGVIRLMAKEGRFSVEEELVALKRHPNPRASDFVTDILDHVDFFQNGMTRELGWQWGLRKILSEIDLILGEPKRYQFRDVPLHKIIPIHELDRISPDGPPLTKLQRIREKILLQLKERGWRRGERPSRELLAEVLRSTDDRQDLPVLTAPTAEGYFLLLNGHHRLAALISLVADQFLPPETLSEIPVQQSVDVNPYRLLLRFVTRESFEEIPSWNWSKVLEFHAEGIRWLEKNGVTEDLAKIPLVHGGHDGPPPAVIPALLKGRRAVSLVPVSQGDPGLSRWRYVGKAGEEAVFELVPASEGKEYLDQKFSAEDEKRLQIPVKMRNQLRPGMIFNILSPKYHPETAAKAEAGEDAPRPKKIGDEIISQPADKPPTTAAEAILAGLATLTPGTPGMIFGIFAFLGKWWGNRSAKSSAEENEGAELKALPESREDSLDPTQALVPVKEAAPPQGLVSNLIAGVANFFNPSSHMRCSLRGIIYRALAGGPRSSHEVQKGFFGIDLSDFSEPVRGRIILGHLAKLREQRAEDVFTPNLSEYGDFARDAKVNLTFYIIRAHRQAKPLEVEAWLDYFRFDVESQAHLIRETRWQGGGRRLLDLLRMEELNQEEQIAVMEALGELRLFAAARELSSIAEDRTHPPEVRLAAGVTRAKLGRKNEVRKFWNSLPVPEQQIYWQDDFINVFDPILGHRNIWARVKTELELGPDQTTYFAIRQLIRSKDFLPELTNLLFRHGDWIKNLEEGIHPGYENIAKYLRIHLRDREILLKTKIQIAGLLIHLGDKAHSEGFLREVLALSSLGVRLNPKRIFIYSPKTPTEMERILALKYLGLAGEKEKALAGLKEMAEVERNSEQAPYFWLAFAQAYAALEKNAEARFFAETLLRHSLGAALEGAKILDEMDPGWDEGFHRPGENGRIGYRDRH